MCEPIKLAPPVIARSTALPATASQNGVPSALARAGAFVLDLLPGPAGLTEDEAARVVHTAARIGYR